MVVVMMMIPRHVTYSLFIYYLQSAFFSFVLYTMTNTMFSSFPLHRRLVVVVVLLVVVATQGVAWAREEEEE